MLTIKNSPNKSLLLPVNFSSEELSLIAYSISFACYAGYELVVYHTCRKHLSTIANTRYSWKEQSEKRMIELMSKFEGQLEEKGVKCFTYVNDDGLEEGVKRLASRHCIEFVVTNGKSKDGRLRSIWPALSTFSLSVLRLVGFPVLVIPPKVKWKNPKRIVLALNGNERYSESQFHAFRDFFESHHMILNVLEVIDGELLRKWNEKELNMWLDGIPFERDVIYGENVPQAITQYAEQVEADLVAAVSFPDYLFKFLLEPSVSKEIALRTVSPLLVLK